MVKGNSAFDYDNKLTNDELNLLKKYHMNLLVDYVMANGLLKKLI